MATKVKIELVDDIDGSEAAETVQFGLDGTAYEIELSEANAARMREALAGFVAVARRPRGVSAPARTATKWVSQKTVRDWAEANGVKVSPRGRIAQSVMDQYAAVH